MNKEQIKQELRLAYKELAYKQEMANFVDPDFMDVIIYEIKAINCKIKSLKERLANADEHNARDFWNGYILSCVNVPIGVIKKESPVCKRNDSCKLVAYK